MGESSLKKAMLCSASGGYRDSLRCTGNRGQSKESHPRRKGTETGGEQVKATYKANSATTRQHGHGIATRRKGQPEGVPSF